MEILSGENKDLLTVTTPVAARWESLGIQLDLEMHVLDRIRETSGRDCTRALIQMLREWKQRSPQTYTWHYLVQALCSSAVGEVRIGREVERKYCVLANWIRPHYSRFAECLNPDDIAPTLYSWGVIGRNTLEQATMATNTRHAKATALLTAIEQRFSQNDDIALANKVRIFLVKHAMPALLGREEAVYDTQPVRSPSPPAVLVRRKSPEMKTFQPVQLLSSAEENRLVSHTKIDEICAFLTPYVHLYSAMAKYLLPGNAAFRQQMRIQMALSDDYDAGLMRWIMTTWTTTTDAHLGLLRTAFDAANVKYTREDLLKFV